MKWTNVLQQFVDAINCSKSRATGMRPVDVNPQNADELWTKLYGDAIGNSGTRPNYKIGDKVRIDKSHGVFAKSYLPTMTAEVFKIKGVHRTKPTSYQLEDLQKEDILGKFYNENFSRTRQEKIIEKVHRQRRRRGGVEYLVSWRNEDPQKKEWISSEMVNNP